MRFGILTVIVASTISMLSSGAFAQCPGRTATLSEIASAVKASTKAPVDVTARSCMWAGAAIAESGGNLCASNGYNFGVLQLSAENVGRLGLTPEEYMDLSLQDQIDNWALVGATDNNASRGYKAIDAKISMILRLGHVIDGVLAACSQFGETICNNDIEKFIEAGKPLPVPNSADAIPCKENTCGHGTANQDGNGHTIVSWGLEIQKKIHMSRCQD